MPNSGWAILRNCGNRYGTSNLVNNFGVTAYPLAAEALEVSRSGSKGPKH